CGSGNYGYAMDYW
nr:immunoglobulin heavy chain junction region [Mus musculus]